MQNNEYNPAAFRIIWTSFGLGQNDAFDPSLAAALADASLYVTFTPEQVDFGVKVDQNRHDLSLLKRLQNTGVKEFYVENFDVNGNRLKTRMKFTAFELSDYTIGNSIDHEGFTSVSTFTLSGVLEVVS